MNVNEFIDKFYTDKSYKEQIINDLNTKVSDYTEGELIEHNKTLDDFHYEMLLNSISNEVYPKTLEIEIEKLVVS